MKNKNIIFIIIITILSLIIVGLSYYAFIYKDNATNNKVSADKEQKEPKEISIDNAFVINLFNNVHPAYSIGIYEPFFLMKKELLVKCLILKKPN